MSIFLGCIDCAVIRGCVKGALRENRAQHSWIYCTLSFALEVLILCTCSCKCKNMWHKFHKISRNGSNSSAGFVDQGQGVFQELVSRGQKTQLQAVQYRVCFASHFTSLFFLTFQQRNIFVHACVLPAFKSFEALHSSHLTLANPLKADHRD